MLEGDILSKAEERAEQILHEIAQARNTGNYSMGWPIVSKINLSTAKEFFYECLEAVKRLCALSTVKSTTQF